MVLKVTRLRRRGLTSRCAPFVDPLPEAFFKAWPEPFPNPLFAPFAPPFCEPSAEPFELPIFEKQARMAAGGNPASADCGYKPRSATSIADGSRSLPTIWIDQSLVPWPAV